MLGNIRIYTRPVKLLNEQEYEACHRLNYGLGGGMQRTLEKCRSRWSRGRSTTIMAWKGNRLVGWCLIFHLTDGRVGVHTYVDKKYRGKGIARKLLARARQGRSYPLVCYESEYADCLYARLLGKGRMVWGQWWSEDRHLVA